MPTLKHLDDHVQRFGLSNKPLYAASIMILFWSIFDGILTYVTPLLLTQHGFTDAEMGFIIGSSSIVGAAFDFLICRIFKRSDYRRIFLVLFLICALYPLVLYKAHAVPMFLAAMAMWGIYYDLFNFGRFNFAGLALKDAEHASGSAVMQVFKALGYLVAPLIAGFAIVETVGSQPFILAWIFLGIAFLFFLFLSNNGSIQKPVIPKKQPRTINLQREVYLWLAASNLLRPVLIITVFLSLYDSFFWTIGPLFAHSFAGGGHLEGLFLTAYEIPILGVGWLIGSLTNRLGKKRTAFLSLGLGSAILIPISFFTSPVMIITIIFLSSLFIAMAIPSVNGAFTDYISEAPKAEKEIVGINDFSMNIGYIVGPALAGTLAGLFGTAVPFTILACAGLLIALLLLAITPKTIDVRALQRAA